MLPPESLQKLLVGFARESPLIQDRLLNDAMHIPNAKNNENENRPVSPTHSDHRFPKSVRILRQFEFDRVHSSQYYAADDTLVIKAVENGMRVSRLGLSVGRRVGNAVVRNRWKRRIREAFRIQRTTLPAGLDLVVRPRKGGICQSKAIKHSIRKLVEKIQRRIQKKHKAKNSRLLPEK